MINKRNSFAHRNVILADRIAFRKATVMEKSLVHWAFDFSVYSERPTPWLEVAETFSLAATTGYKPSEEDFRSFMRACKTAHRMESSLRVEHEGMDEEFFVNNPLTLRIKFYYKNNRQEFLEWKMTFGEMGRIHQAGMTGHGGIGQEVMASEHHVKVHVPCLGPYTWQTPKVCIHCFKSLEGVPADEPCNGGKPTQ